MSLKEQGHDAASAHPNPIDMNRSIVWARYHADSDEWLALAVRVTRRPDESGLPEPSIATIALVDRTGRPLIEAMIKAPNMVSNEEIARHGVDQSVVFNAKSFEQVIHDLLDTIGDKTLVSWDPDDVQNIFNELSKYHQFAPRRWQSHSVSKEYARFVGKTDDPKNGYKLQALPVTGVSAVDECRACIKLINDIAGASQATDEIATGKPGWTAEFYRPKVGTKDKLKGLFGINS